MRQGQSGRWRPRSRRHSCCTPSRSPAFGDTDFSATLDDWLAQDREGPLTRASHDGCATKNRALGAALGVLKLAGVR
jgi:hypothetical protein